MRYARTFWLVARFLVQLWLLKRLSPLLGSRRQRVAGRLYRRQALKFVDFATQMGGLIIKVGQFLSVRIDLLPKDYIDVLSTLQDALPPVPTDQIVAVIERELKHPLGTIFGSFAEVPEAAASLGQVHRATLPDGTPVAVKVLRPGIEDLVETDLGLLRRLLRLLDRLTGLGSRVDIAALEADFTTTFTDELDYVKEAQNAEAFQADLLFNPHVDIPQVYWERSTRRVLTMEYMAGTPIDDLDTIDAWGVDRHALATNLAGLFFEMVLNSGRFHADPHPGNVFVRPDGVIQLIDFGMVGQITPEARARYASLLTALVRRDARGVVASLQALGFLGPGADAARLTELIGPYIDTIVGDVVGFYTGGSIVDSLMTGNVHLNVGPDVLADLQEFILTQPIVMPGQTTFLGKALITVIGLCLRLDPGLDLLGTATPYVTSQQGVAGLAYDLATRGIGTLTELVPRAHRLLDTVRRIEDGSVEAGVVGRVQAGVDQAARRQTRTLMRALAAAVGVIIVVLTRRR